MHGHEYFCGYLCISQSKLHLFPPSNQPREKILHLSGLYHLLHTNYQHVLNQDGIKHGGSRSGERGIMGRWLPLSRAWMLMPGSGKRDSHIWQCYISQIGGLHI